ncbi:hypothetical protein FRC10_003274 [Ceratobasidium sp. 414]|nr:hypothetical protein FRC10_003274 [Ceratobasidium sp. 414]
MALETTALGPFVVPRVWTGLWQLSSPAWGTAPAARIKREMMRHVREGYTAFGQSLLLVRNPNSPCSRAAFDSHLAQTWVSSIGGSAPIVLLIPPLPADHYGSAEILFGQFRQTLEDPDSVVGATKWCVFAPTEITRQVVEDGVRERMERMRTEHVDLLQFHWQNYDDKAYLDALNYLRELQAEGMITAIGLCNFDTIRTDEICASLGPGAIVSNQVQVSRPPPAARRITHLIWQFSLIDTRPLDGMDDVCRKHGVKLLTYGSLCGGFLADKWLGAPEPDAYRETMTPSQRKYLDMILKAWGTWPLFQSLLGVLRRIGDRHGGVSIANVSTRWVLQHDFVGAVIIGSSSPLYALKTKKSLGARLGVSEHTSDNLQAFSFRLTQEDLKEIESVLDESNGRNLVRTIGDCGSEYR